MKHNEIYRLVEMALEKEDHILRKFALGYLGPATEDKKYAISIWGYGFSFPTPKLILEFEDNILIKQNGILPHVSSAFLE